MQAYRALLMKWNPDKNSPATSPKQEAEPKLKPLTEAYEGIFGKKKLKSLSLHGFGFSSKDSGDKGGSGKGRSAKGGSGKDKGGSPKEGYAKGGSAKGGSARGDDPTTSPIDGKDQKNNDDAFLYNLPRSTSSTEGNRRQPNFPRSSSTSDGNRFQPNLPRSTSTRDGGISRSSSTRDGNPIRFSYSAAPKKPPPMEKQLECTLEDLWQGCVKKIMLTRNVLADTGVLVEEQELLRIKVKPGWKKGTKITFEGIGDERPGMLPADVIFSIVEKEHPLFKREGDDLVLAFGVSLADALTGCMHSFPLLGGENMSIWINDIIYPGYEKSIAGQGMPIPNDNGKRGSLRIRFQVEFPTKLSEDQRSDLFSILLDASDVS